MLFDFFTATNRGIKLILEINYDYLVPIWDHLIPMWAMSLWAGFPHTRLKELDCGSISNHWLLHMHSTLWDICCLSHLDDGNIHIHIHVYCLYICTCCAWAKCVFNTQLCCSIADKQQSYLIFVCKIILVLHHA